MTPSPNPMPLENRLTGFEEMTQIHWPSIAGLSLASKPLNIFSTPRHESPLIEILVPGILTTKRRLSQMIDPLDQLLAEVKHEAFLLRKKVSQAPHLKSAPIRHQADYSDWKVGGTVTLIHTSPSGKETSLGTFVEHTRAHTRWLRPTTDSLAPGHREIVTGAWWLEPTLREIPHDSPSEVASIRARFEELIAMYPEERAPGDVPDRPLDPPEPMDDPFEDEDEDLQDEVDDEDEEEDDDE